MVDYARFRILVDLPAVSPALGFGEAADGLASLVRNSEPQFAIAVFGPWGSGKTTLMNAIRASLEGDGTALERRIVTAEFSAWRYEKEEHLILPLLDTVRAALVAWAQDVEAEPGGADGGRGARFVEAARETAGTVGRVMASLLAGFSFRAGLPGSLELTYEANRSLQHAEGRGPLLPTPGTGSFASRLDAPDLPQSVYHASFTALARAFRAFDAATEGARIVVFVDDLDRCLPEGTLQVLESMKLFFDLRGFVFVVGLDRDVVERCIDVSYGRGGDGTQAPLVRGADYIKKIFQVPYSLAPVSVQLLDELFESMRADSRLPDEQMEDLAVRVRRHLDFLFSDTRVNPREVKRYINAYVIQMKVKPGLDADVVLALGTLDFRQDCRALSDSLATWREETVEALRLFLGEGDASLLEDVDLGAADLPADVRAYLDAGGPGAGLLTTPDLATYLDAGAATRTSEGGYLLDLLGWYREVKREIRRGLEAREPMELDGAWSAANSHLQVLDKGLGDLSRAKGGKTRLGLHHWLDPQGDERAAWRALLDALGDPDRTPSEELRAEARREADVHLAELLGVLREQRRRASLEG